MTAPAKTFHIGDILSITTGRLVSPRRMDGVYDILAWMTGDSVFTHQISRVCGECAPSLREQFPDLAGITVPDALSGEEGILLWLEGEAIIHGDTRDVVPLAREDHTRIDPLAELRIAAPQLQVIAVEAAGEETGG